jgi:flagellar hook-basal body complex protein FliE
MVKSELIDTSRIEAMVTQLKAAGSRAQLGNAGAEATKPAAKLDFADALKASLEEISARQQQAQKMAQDFAMGDDMANLSDVMIAMQKASISFQAAVQVRNRLVSAYHDIMNMQV